MTATSVIIPASGQGKRLGSSSDKAFIDISGIPMLARTLRVFQDYPDISEIILVVRDEYISTARQLVQRYNISKVSCLVTGGDVRQDSVRNGLTRIAADCEVVLIHDAARPFITPDIIRNSISAAIEHKAAIVAVPVINTIKASSDNAFVESTLNRETLFAVQTPQTFNRQIIENAYKIAYDDCFYGTDDASLVERLGVPVKIVEGAYDNIKITTPNDIATAESIIRQREGTTCMNNNFRIGHGYDIHKFEKGRRLVLGGVEFQNEDGLLGHSDADVLLHAVADSILGAAGAGDIGKHFPDTDPDYKDADSLALLASAGEIINSMGWVTGNVDVTLIAEKPRVSKHTCEMERNIGKALGISPDLVNIKATTAEGLGDIGRAMGIECHAVALLLPLI
ncbi:MAG: 2-C-methyl-D-erythritol 4-phosphate cytidylyltransferase [Armatimonadota bacterium]